MSSDSGNFAPWKFIKDKKVFAHQLCQGSTWLSLCLVNQKCQIMSKKINEKQSISFFQSLWETAKGETQSYFIVKTEKMPSLWSLPPQAAALLPVSALAALSP